MTVQAEYWRKCEGGGGGSFRGKHRGEKLILHFLSQRSRLFQVMTQHLVCRGDLLSVNRRKSLQIKGMLCVRPNIMTA